MSVGQHTSDVGRCFAHAKADFQHHRVGGWRLGIICAIYARWLCVSSYQINSRCLVGQQKLRAQFFKRFCLAGGGAPGAFDEALDGAHEGLGVGGGSVRFDGGRVFFGGHAALS